MDTGLVTASRSVGLESWQQEPGWWERLTGALLDRRTQDVHIVEMNGESCRLRRSQETAVSQAPNDADEE